jgi:RES domain-containing protein
VWRLTRRGYADLAGQGGVIVEGRWHSAGSPIVYLAENPALALLEVRVHLDLPFSSLPLDYVFMKISLPDDLPIRDLKPLSFEIIDTRMTGDTWLSDATEPVAMVSSVVAPFSYNYLLNPDHKDASNVTILDIVPFQFDRRLW